MSLCLPVSLSTCLAVYLSLCLHISLSTCLYVYLSICISVYLSNCLTVYLSLCLPVYLSLCYVMALVEEALHGSHVFCLNSHVRWRCAEAQRENTKRILLLFSYGNIICRHLQKFFFSGLYKLMDIHFGSILFCNSNPDADR